MAVKQVTIVPKGMQRDLAVSKFNPDFAYENMNIRITATDDNTLMSITNEKGNRKIEIDGIESIKGIPIGEATIDKYIVLFTTGDLDRIYKIWKEGDTFKGVELVATNLNFSPEHPIETLPSYESELVKKVYWVDGVNQPRVINIERDSSKYTNTSFDFVPELKLEEEVKVTKNIDASGKFPAGIIQYSFTYFNKYGQESNIFYTTPMMYVSYTDRGGSPEDKISNSFSIALKNLDPNFEYVRIYSTFRTSINSEVTAKVVADIKNNEDVFVKTEVNSSSGGIGLRGYGVNKEEDIKIYDNGSIKSLSDYPYEETGTRKTYTIRLKGDSGIVTPDGTSFIPYAGNRIELYKDSLESGISYMIASAYYGTPAFTYKRDVNYIDTGSDGFNIDSTSLLFKGGESIVAGTISQKDNTLFLGNLKLEKIFFDSAESNLIKNSCTPKFVLRTLPYNKPEGYYPYTNSLNKSSLDIKEFKGGEVYKIAIQFQHKNGKFSEPVYLDTITNPFYPEISEDTIKVAKLECDTSKLESLSFLSNYKKARLLISVTNAQERSVICQGILCPTVFNLADRCSNAPYAYSSWFMRFNSYKGDPFRTIQYRHNSPLPSNSYRSCEIQATVDPKLPYIPMEGIGIAELKASFFFTLDSPIATIGGYVFFLWQGTPSSKHIIVQHSSHTYAEGKAFASQYVDIRKIPSESEWASHDNNNPVEIVVDSSSTSKIVVNDFIDNQGNNFYVDQSILTLHSPDINEFGVSSNLSNAKMRIVGIIQNTAVMTYHDVISSTNVRTKAGKKEVNNKGELPYYPDNPNLSFNPSGLISAPLWHDSTGGDSGYQTVFATYPWHREGSLNDDKNSTDNSGNIIEASAKLQSKVFSNLRFCYYTKYFSKDKVWENPTGITQVSIFNSDTLSNIRIPKPENSKLSDFNYYGNADKMVFYSSGKDGKGFPIQCVGPTYDDFIYNSLDNDYVPVEGVDGKDPVRIRYKSTPHAVFALNYTKDGNQCILPALNSSDLFSEYDKGASEKGILPWDYDDKLVREIHYISTTQPSNPKIQENWWNPNTGMMYMYLPDFEPSIPWYPYIYALRANFSEYQNWVYKNKSHTLYKVSGDTYELKETGRKINQDNVNYGESDYPFLYVAELYRDLPDNTNNGDTIENVMWIPAGNPSNIGSILSGEEGDTYFQRWDCLKTYAYSEGDTNQVVDIVSCMIETRFNVDGRYDRNRGQKNNTIMSPTNFNLYNPVYNQTNNFFNYRDLDSKFDNIVFPNSITWSLTKQEAEDIDTWTNITMASILNLDGDKGPVKSIKRWNNNLIAFQDKGISHILYNENVQIASTEGVPIEIANSGKVQGKRYISEKIGCYNKWSICETPAGLYFIDDFNKTIYMYNGQLSNVSSRGGFDTWIHNKITKPTIWNPKDFKGIVSYYDKTHGDVLFIDGKECLAFSEPLNSFSSFYSYEHTPYFIPYEDYMLSINKENIQQEEGSYIKSEDYKLWSQNDNIFYNIYFGKYNPFYTTLIVNPEPNVDKIFNNVEFLSDTWLTITNPDTLEDETFDTLKVWNEYQEGEENLENIFGIPSPLKQKYRIWRANIPRNKNTMDRMRNPWIYLKLSKEKENPFKTVLHNITVRYFD